MIRSSRSSSISYNFLLRARRATTSTCSIPPELPASPSVSSDNHYSYCLSLTDDLLRFGHLSSAKQVVRRLIKQSPSISDALYAVEFASLRGIDIDSGICSSLIRKMVSSGQHQLAETYYYKSVFGKDVDGDLEILNHLVIALCKLRKLDDAVSNFNRIVSIGSFPCEKACNELVTELCSDGRLIEGYHLFVTICNANVYLSMRSYNMLIDELCGKGYMDGAVQVLDIMCERTGLPPTLHLYKSLFYGFCKNGMAMEAESLFEDMESRGFFVDKTMYTSLMKAYCKDRKMKMVMRVYCRMLQSGVDPDETVYMTMINAYCKAGKAMQARDLFKEMRKNGIQPTAYSYTLLISGLVKRNMIDKGIIYLKRMWEDGFVPNKAVYTALISYYFRKSDFKFACRLCNFMGRIHIEEDLILIIAMLCGFCRNIKAKPFMVSRGAERNRGMLLQLLRHHLLRQVTPVPRHNSLRLSADSPEEMEIIALNIMHRVKQSPFMPNIFLYNCIISGFCRADRMQDAYDHFELMEKDCICPNAVTFTILMEGHIRAGEIDGAIWLFNKMNSSYCNSDRVACDVLLKGLCNAGRLLDALSLCYTMHKRGYYPTKHSYRTLLDSLCNHKQSASAVRLFEEMTAHKYFPSQSSCKWLVCILYEEQKFQEAFLVCDMFIKSGKFQTNNNESSDWRITSPKSVELGIY